ncbi:MAG: efflux RND transporter permease subunit [Phycisphaerales bacterium]|nr:efflux RND transporter permease subunit [Phycisphaerales bacterium]
MNALDLGDGVQALVDGLKIGDYRYRGDSIDLLVTRGDSYELNSDNLALVPLAVVGNDGSHKTIPLSSVATVKRADAPQQINRVEQQRSITLQVIVPPEEPLEQAMSEIQAMIPDLRNQGKIALGVGVNLGGTADKLVQVREALTGQVHDSFWQTFQSFIQSRLFLALLINYLLMCALFESWVYPLVIMFSVPLATIGGFLGLRITHEFVPTQLLDVVTMLGFVILIGTVVNNSILIVSQALNYMRGFGESELDKVERFTPRQAIRESVRTRMRPVMMTTLTTLLGLLPLVLKPGSGSEIYRGLGSVVLGGLLVSTVFTLLVVPVIFSLVIDLKVGLYRRLGWEIEPELRD